MVAKDFEVDDLVWAKMKGFPPWPARIAQPQDPKSPSSKKQQHFVYFYGTHNYAWILDEKITPHSEQMLKNSESYKKKPAALQKAIQELEDESREVEPTPKEPVKAADKQQTPKRPLPKAQIQKRSCAKKRRTASAEEDDESEFLTETNLPQSPKERSLLGDTARQNCKDDLKAEDSSDDDELVDNVQVTSNNGCSNVAVIPPFNDDSSAVAHPQPKSVIDRKVVPRPPTPPLDVLTPHKTLIAKNIKTTSRKIGFLGLGLMGRGMVKNLLNSNHDVTIWNRTTEKCIPFVDAGAKLAETPSDVVAGCDIIFCCVSDPGTAKMLVFGNCGVLRGFNSAQTGKGYVDMTSVDPATSMEIAEAITDKGGRYLEAPIVGCRKRAEEGSLVVMGCGDQSLFKECESCFSAVAKNAYYLGCDIGSGAKMNLVLSMLTGNICASLGESMALLDTCKLNGEDFLEVLKQGNLGCDLIVGKCQAMMAQNYETSTALKHQQKDLSLALQLGNNESQQLHMAAAANEIFKRARLLRYSDHDVSAVQIGAKF